MNVSAGFKKELETELQNILLYWMQFAPDEKEGGFYGRIAHDNTVDARAPKGAVLNSRILWTFAAAYNQSGRKDYFVMAERALQYILDYFLDKEHGGVYWSVDHQGRPLDTKKQVYAQAFALYGCSEFYRSRPGPELKQQAIDLYKIIVGKSFDQEKTGFLEAFTKEWAPIENLRLSDKDANEKKTMNTHLHVLEAFTNLYRIWPDPGLEMHIRWLLEDFINHIINQQSGHLNLFFDEDWTVKSSIISYGHDIEAAWLLPEAAEAIRDQALINKVNRIAVSMAIAAARGLDKDGGLWYEYNSGTKHLVTEKHWWPQAEAMVGFFRAWEISGDRNMLQYSLNSWAFIQEHILDKRNGEWVWGVQRDHSRMQGVDKAGFWKGPYHNGRACMEVARRIG